MPIKKAKPTTKASTAAPARKKLALKKDAIKDLPAAATARGVKGGGYTTLCNGGGSAKT